VVVTAVDRDVQALFDAAFAGDIGTIWSLLDADSSLVWESVGDLTALHVAAMAGKDEAAALLIAKRAAVNASGSAGTPLFQAALAGHETIVDRLLANGADPDLATPSGQTPLMAAAAGGRLACGRLLLDAGVNANAKTTAGPDELRPWPASVNGESALHYASDAGWVEFATLLLEQGVDVNPVDRDGHTPLDRAVQRGQDAVARVLKEFATVERKQPHDRT
jgi:ankyrin repeat protein